MRQRPGHFPAPGKITLRGSACEVSSGDAENFCILRWETKSGEHGGIGVLIRDRCIIGRLSQVPSKNVSVWAHWPQFKTKYNIESSFENYLYMSLDKMQYRKLFLNIICTCQLAKYDIGSSFEKKIICTCRLAKYYNTTLKIISTCGLAGGAVRTGKWLWPCKQKSEIG